MDAPATPFTSFAFKYNTPSPTTSSSETPYPPHPQPRTKRARQRSPSFSDEPSLFSYSCTPHFAGASTSQSAATSSSPERPTAPLLPSFPIFSGPKHHLTSTPMKRSPGMQNLNLFTRRAFEEEREDLGLGLDCFLPHLNDYTSFAFPAAPMDSPSASSISSGSPSTSYFDDEPWTPTSTPSRSRSTTPATPYTVYTPSYDSLSSLSAFCTSPLAPRSSSPSLAPALLLSPSFDKRVSSPEEELSGGASDSLGLGIAF